MQEAIPEKNSNIVVYSNLWLILKINDARINKIETIGFIILERLKPLPINLVGKYTFFQRYLQIISTKAVSEESVKILVVFTNGCLLLFELRSLLSSIVFAQSAGRKTTSSFYDQCWFVKLVLLPDGHVWVVWRVYLYA